MAVDGIKKAFQVQVKKDTEVAPKPKPKPTQTGTTNSFANSKLSEGNHTGNMLRHKIQKSPLQNNNGNPEVTPTPVQAFLQKTDPYENQTAQEIADERIEVYNNADDRKDSAEETGRIIADIAIHDPEKANEVADLFLGNEDVRGKDKDELAQEFVQELSDDELKQIAGSDDGEKLLEGMREQLLGGSVHLDESQDAGRITSALNSTKGLFTGEYGGAEMNADIPVNPVFEDTTPSQGAQFLKFNPHMDSGVKAQTFTQALEAHQDDPEWIANFFAELGPETTADLISQASSPSTYSGGGFGGDAESARQSLDVVTDSLDNLVKGGFLNQEGMDTLVNEFADGGVSTYFATEVLANASPEVKTMFVNSAIATGNDGLAPLAMHVLNTLPVGTEVGGQPNTQKAILEGLTTDQLNTFINGAMSGQGQIPSFDGRVENPMFVEEFVEFGNVENLIGNATQQTMQYYPYTSESPFSLELKTNLFNAATLALDSPRVFDNFKNNEEFETNISRLFIENRDSILRSNSSENNGSISINGEKRLERFFQLTLMTPPQTASYDALSKSVFEYVNNVSSALQADGLSSGDPAAYQDFVNTHGMTPEDSAQLLGGVLGTIVDSAGNAQSEINKDNAARLAQIQFFTGLAFAFIPGASDAIAGGITNEFVKHFAEEGTKYFQGKVVGGIQSQLDTSLANLGKENPQEAGQLANLLFRELLGIFPNGDAETRVIDGEAIQIPTINLQSQFQQGFDNTTRYTLNDDARNGE